MQWSVIVCNQIHSACGCTYFLSINKYLYACMYHLSLSTFRQERILKGIGTESASTIFFHSFLVVYVRTCCTSSKQQQAEYPMSPTSIILTIVLSLFMCIRIFFFNSIIA